MSGNRKMYKRGLADAMQAYEGFSEKQKAALEQLRREVESGTKQLETALEDLGDELNGIYQYLNAKEKAALYHLSTPLDIKKLDLPEQQLLIAILYQLADDEGALLTEYQRTYIRSIQRYLGITNPQTNADLSVVGDIDSLDTQKAFLQVTLEFLYLQNGEELTDAQEDFLGNFSVNKRQALAIERCVSRLYNAVDAQGVAEKYGAQVEVQFSPDAIAEKMKKLNSYIDELGKSGACIFAYISTEHDWNKMSVAAGDDSCSFKDRSRCQQTAERELERYHRSVEKEISAKVAKNKEDSIYASFKRSFETRINWVKDSLSQVRTLSSAGIVDQMTALLTTADFLQKAAQTYENLETKYRLGSIGTYKSDITYDSWDPSEFETGFAKLIAKAAVRYGYNILSAVQAMERDGTACLNDYQEEFNYTIEGLLASTYVEPLEALLPHLYDALNNPCD